MRFYSMILLLVAIVSTGCCLASGSYCHNNVSHVGKEFYLAFPPCFQTIANDTSFSCKLTMFGETQQFVTVSVESVGYSETRILAPFEVVEWRLPLEVAQFMQHSSTSSLEQATVFSKSALRVSAEHSVSVYVSTSFEPYFGSYVAYPSEFHGGRFDLETVEHVSTNNGEDLPAMLVFVSIADSTKIAVFSEIFDETSQTHKDTAILYTIQEGDVLLVSTQRQGQKLRSMESFIIFSAPAPLVFTAGYLQTDSNARPESFDFVMNQTIPYHPDHSILQ